MTPRRRCSTHALGAIDGPVYIDLADAKAGVRAWLEAVGFAPQRPFTRMLLGRDTSFDDEPHLCGDRPEFG